MNDPLYKHLFSCPADCEQLDILMTLGIKPSNPNTGYGYIKCEPSETEIKKVQKFTEKPDLETAKQFLNDGDYLWNAGIFVWSVKSILKAFKTYLPKMYTLFSEGENSYNTSLEKQFIEENYDCSENISIDFGIMEKASDVFVLPVSFGWNDLGTWGSLYNKLPKDDSQNATVGGNVIYRDAKNNIVRTQSGKRVVIQGLNIIGGTSSLGNGIDNSGNLILRDLSLHQHAGAVGATLLHNQGQVTLEGNCDIKDP